MIGNLFVFAVLCFTLSDAEDVIKLSPTRLVVEYGAPASANCSTNVTHFGMGWEASSGAVDMTPDVEQLTWTVPNLTDWDIKPFCFINTKEQSRLDLQVTIYKKPDYVSIFLVNASSAVEGTQHEFKCKVLNVAPPQNVTVKFYKGLTLLESRSITEVSITPKDASAAFRIKPSRDDNGAQYRCEAWLELGPEGPQPLPKVTSSPLVLNVNYGPKFSKSEEILEYSDEEVSLNCTVRANPTPTYTWSTPVPGEKSNKAVLLLPLGSSGTYNCTAENQYGKEAKQFIIKPPNRGRTTFWAIMGAGLALIGVLLGVYLLIKKSRSNSVV